MTTADRTVTLHFGSDADDAQGEDTLRGQLSAVVQIERDLWLASDESNSVERLSPSGRGAYGDHRMFRLEEVIDLPGGPDEEIDVEGMSHDGGYLWIAGSHGLKRRKADPEKNPEKQIARLAEVRSDGNRYLLARIPVGVGEDGATALFRQHDAGDGEPRTSARLMGSDRGNVLMDALRLDEHLAPFLNIPSKDNGFDVEGLVVCGDRAFLGLRGPVLRGWAVVLELRLEDEAPGLMRLGTVGRRDRPYRKHFLDLRGLGVRELTKHGDDILVLAGPTMDLDGPAAVYRWRDGLADGKDDTLVGRDDLDEVIALPYGVGKDGAFDHPEGCTLFGDDESDRDALLVVYDAPDESRAVGESGVRADVFEI